jgi:hypothetical protein
MLLRRHYEIEPAKEEEVQEKEEKQPEEKPQKRRASGK